MTKSFASRSEVEVLIISQLKVRSAKLKSLCQVASKFGLHDKVKMEHALN